MKKSIAIILLCLFSQVIWGQRRPTFQFEKGLSKDAISLGIIVVKLKSTSSQSINSSNNKSSRLSSTPIGPETLNTELKKLGVKEVRKVFKDNRSILSTSAHQIDLSGIYFLQIDPALDLEASINLLLQNENVEYAEPYYNHKILVVPNDPFSYSSSIAYSTIFSLPAILVIIMRVATYFYSDEAVTGQLYPRLAGILGKESALTIEEAIKNAHSAENGFLATVVSIITLLLSATTVFLSIQYALNNIWGVRPKPSKGILRILINRLLSFSIVIGLGFIMLVSLLIEAMVGAFRDYIEFVFSDLTATLIQGINYIVSLGVITIIFAMIFKVLPDARVRWKDVWIGSFVTTIFFIIGRLLIGLYLGSSRPGTTYGAAGSIVVILIWVYYSSFIMLLGGIFTQVYATHKGRRVLPARHAVFIVKRELDPEIEGIEVVDEIVRNKDDKQYI